MLRNVSSGMKSNWIGVKNVYIPLFACYFPFYQTANFVCIVEFFDARVQMHSQFDSTDTEVAKRLTLECTNAQTA